ncbi:PAP2 family protein [Clostridiales bacterium KA00134]|nr:PAP2 family protein [Clostridiales bacterium KA00134]
MEFKILDLIYQLRNPVLDKIFAIYTSLGDGGLIFILMGLVLLIKRKSRKTGIRVIISLILCLIVGNFILKPIIARPRPYNFKDVKMIVASLKDYSFPSGHSYAAMAFAKSIYYEYKKAGKIFFILALIMGFSRLYAYVHYPTDVAVGLLLGYLFAICANKIIKLASKANQKTIKL